MDTNNSLTEANSWTKNVKLSYSRILNTSESYIKTEKQSGGGRWLLGKCK